MDSFFEIWSKSTPKSGRSILVEKVLGSFSGAWLSFRGSHALSLSKIKYPLLRSFIWYIKHFAILSGIWENWEKLQKIEWKKRDRADIKLLHCRWAISSFDALTYRGNRYMWYYVNLLNKVCVFREFVMTKKIY